MKNQINLVLNLLLVLTIIMSSSVFAQEEKTEKKGFIGVTLGAAFPTGDFADNDVNNIDAGLAENGLNITLATFGYYISDNFGLAGSWFGGGHTIETDFGNGIWSYGALVVGPMYTTQVNETTFLDFKVMAGPTAGLFDFDSLDDVESGSGFGYDLGVSLRFNLSEKIGFMLNADYFSTNAEFDDFEQQMSAFNLNGGILFRI